MILIGVLCAAVIWIYWDYMIKPVNIDIKNLMTELSAKQQKLETTRQAAIEYLVLDAEHKILKLEIIELERKLPYKKDLPKLIHDITKSLEKNRISIQSFVPDQEMSKDYYSETSITLRVTGTYHDLANFLAEIGQYERIINTFDLSIAPLSPTKFSSDTISASLRLVIYIGK